MTSLRTLARNSALPISALAVLACAPRTGAVPASAEPRDAFWASLRELCGKAYAGTLVEGNASDSAFRRETLRMHVRQCSADTIRIPFHLGADRSRTWVVTRTATGLRLKHDHRHADGAEDSVTQYGGDTRDAGTATRQEFAADAHTARLIPAARTNVWTMEIVPGRTFAYALRREGTDRRFRVEFDLTRPVPAPAAPWGYAPQPGDGEAPADTLRIDGSPGVQPLVEALVRAYRARVPGAAVVVAGGMGSRQRADAVADGRIGIAMASHGADEAALRARGIAVHAIARTAVVFAANEGAGASGLSRAQLCGIYRGEITSWRTLGGRDLGILPLTRPPEEVDAEVVMEGVPCLKTLPTPLTATVVPGADEMARELARTRGAIGMTSMPYVQQSGGRLRALALDGVEPTSENVRSGRWTMTRRALLLAKASATPEVERFLEFVRSEEGAQVIAENGAVVPGATR